MKIKIERLSFALSIATLAGLGVIASSFYGKSASAKYGPIIEDLGVTQLHLTAVVRDFKGMAEAGGHPDFENYTGTTRIGHVEDRLGPDGKPVFKSPYGVEIISEYRDRSGNNINPMLYSPAIGDVVGKLESKTDKKITSRASFDQWYRDVAGVNVSKTIDLTLNLDEASGRYVFDSALDEPYRAIGGFFPIDRDLYGNFPGWDHNFHFTTELSGDFDYEKGRGHIFKFTGDDDVWVFIDGRLVIDLGSMHPKREQMLELDRLAWLEDGGRYTLKIFHAERHTRESNFRIETTLKLRRVQVPETSGKYD